MRTRKREIRLTDITAIGRAIDPSYPTNRAIAALAVLLLWIGWSTFARSQFSFEEEL